MLYMYIQKSVAFLFANNEQSREEIKKIIPFTVASKGIKHLGINLIKEVQDSYTENYKPSWKEVIEDLNKWEDITILIQQNT